MNTVKEFLDALGFDGPDHDENVRAALRELQHARRTFAQMHVRTSAPGLGLMDGEL